VTVTFDEARRRVQADWPDYDPAPFGFESDADWFVLLLPETIGGRIAAVSKESGDIRWINENADEYVEDRTVGDWAGVVTGETAAASLRGWEGDLHHALALADPVARAAALEELAKEQSRDHLGRFASGGGGVRESLASETSIGGLNQAASAELSRILGHDVRVDMTGSHLGTAKEHLEGVTRVAERFPTANLTSVTTGALNTNTYAHAVDIRPGGPPSLRAPDTNHIVFNSVYASPSGRAEYLSSLKNDTKGWDREEVYGISDRKVAGFHVRNGDTPIAVGAHEMGHIVDFSTGHRTEPAVRGLVSRLASREKSRQTLPGTPIRDPADFIHRTVSAYGRTNTGELIAEAVSDVAINGSGASKLSTGIVSILQQEAGP
jgi:hypothetical protein